MMKKIFILFFILSLPCLSFSQGEGNHWYFGYNAGLDFSSGSPLPDLNGALNTWEGCSSVSDKNGNLLFYTDGSTVYNRNHIAMPNGTGLLGNSSSTQSAIIVKRTGTDTLYYIFTTPAVSTGGLYYSEVNLRLNGGLGDVVLSSKNTNLLPVVGERVTAARHSNGIYTWIITKVTNTNSYYAFLIDCNGVQPPVITNIGLTASGNNAGATVASPDNKRIASTFFSTTNAIEILDFDNSTGILSNAITQGLGAYPYGACFSPDSRLFYYSNIASGNAIQLDLHAGNGSAADILASATVIGTISGAGLGGFRAGALQLGPDSKIYMAGNGQNDIAVINNPNTIGAGCNFVFNGVSLGGQVSGLGLPALFLNFIDTTVINYSIQCVNAPVEYSINGDSTAIDSVHWNFGDIASGVNNHSAAYSPSHTYSASGSYNVELIRFFLCGSDTNNITVSIAANNVNAGINGNDSLCFGNTLQLSASGGVSYKWLGPGNYSDTIQTINIGSPAAGLYTALATDNNGCRDTATLNVNIFPNPVASAGANNPVPVGNTINLTTDTTGGIIWTGPNAFSNSQQNPAISNAQLNNAGTYQVIKTNVFGCSDTAQVLVSVYQPEIPDNGIDDDNDSLIDCADPDLATLSQCYRCGYDSVAWKTVIPEAGFNKGIAVKYTGFEQHFVVPAGVTSIKIKAWGAGGGGGYSTLCNFMAGAGGYTTDQLTTVAGETYVIITGEGGWATRHINQTARATFGFGGSGNSMGASATSEVGSGGGLSGIFLSTVNQADARVIAGGGGAIGDADGYDPTSGGNGNNPLAGGYLPLTGQNAITNSTGFGGGGGGYMGGISGINRFSCNIQLPETAADGGEGGSGFKYTSSGQIKFTPEPNIYPPDTADEHYIQGIGVGTDYNMAIGAVGDIKTGGNGLIVIQWFEPIIDLTIAASKTSLCNGDTLSMIATGPGTYTWTPAGSLNNSTSAQVVATPISDVTYQVISNNNNCKDTAQIQITVNPLPVANFGADTICLGLGTAFIDSSFVSTGSITNRMWSFGDNTAAVGGNNPSHQYSICGNFNAQLLVTTNFGCIDSIVKPIIVNCLPAPNAGLNDTVCFAESTQLTVAPNGPGYTYSWDKPASVNFSTAYNPFVNPAATTSYTVTLTDANGCSGIDSVTIFADSEILLTKTIANVSCNSACDGQINIVASGGTTPYQYDWSSSCTTANCNNLCPGTYSLTVTDAWGCLANTDTSISEPASLLAFISNSESASCNNSCDGTALASAIGGTPGTGYIYSWNTNPVQNTSAAGSLCAGTYTCSITDANACIASTTIVITAPSDITVLTTVSPTDCNDSTGTAIATAFGGTPGYTFSWSPGGNSSQTVNGLAASTYTVTVTDTNGCTQSQTAVVNTAAGPTVIVTASDNNILSGNSTVLNTTGSGSYHWSPNTTLNCDTCQDPTASPVETTSYCVIVTDTNSCADSACITIQVEYPCDLTVPNAFSPNNDGHNDLFVLHGWDKCVAKFSIIIFNRWGEKVFESDNPQKSWTGISENEQMLNSAVFVYFLKATLNSGEKITRQGNVSVIR